MACRNEPLVVEFCHTSDMNSLQSFKNSYQNMNTFFAFILREKNPKYLLTLSAMGGGLYAPPLLFFAPYSKNLQAIHTSKILDFSQLFIADAPKKKKINKFSFTPAQSTFGTPNTNYYFKFLCFNQKNLHTNPS